MVLMQGLWGAEHSARDARALFETPKAARRHGALHPGRRPEGQRCGHPRQIQRSLPATTLPKIRHPAVQFYKILSR